MASAAMLELLAELQHFGHDPDSFWVWIQDAMPGQWPTRVLIAEKGSSTVRCLGPMSAGPDKPNAKTTLRDALKEDTFEFLPKVNVWPPMKPRPPLPNGSAKPPQSRSMPADELDPTVKTWLAETLEAGYKLALERMERSEHGRIRRGNGKRQVAILRIADALLGRSQ